MDARPEYRRDEYIRSDVAARIMCMSMDAFYCARYHRRPYMPPAYRRGKNPKRGPLLFKYGEVIDAIERMKESP